MDYCIDFDGVSNTYLGKIGIIVSVVTVKKEVLAVGCVFGMAQIQKISHHYFGVLLEIKQKSEAKTCCTCPLYLRSPIFFLFMKPY